MQYELILNYKNKQYYLDELFDYLSDKHDCSVHITTKSPWKPKVIERITSEIDNYCAAHNIFYLWNHIQLEMTKQQTKKYNNHRRPIKSDQ